ncbi:hypothetical protein CBL_13186 [Carabus blaptoides fortunei]
MSRVVPLIQSGRLGFAWPESVGYELRFKRYKQRASVAGYGRGTELSAYDCLGFNGPSPSVLAFLFSSTPIVELFTNEGRALALCAPRKSITCNIGGRRLPRRLRYVSPVPSYQHTLHYLIPTLSY